MTVHVQSYDTPTPTPNPPPYMHLLILQGMTCEACRLWIIHMNKAFCKIMVLKRENAIEFWNGIMENEAFSSYKNILAMLRGHFISILD